MCLFSEYKGAKIAKEDIIVYKSLRYVSKGKFASQYFRFVYKLGRSYKTEFSYGRPFEFNCPGITRRVVLNGFHSFAHVPGISKFWKAVQFTIPKGARYYKGIYGDFVSTQIICNYVIN